MFGLTLRCVPGGPLLRTAAGVRLVRAASCRPSMAAATAATAAAGAGIRAGSTRIACRRGYAADAGSEDDAADPEDDGQGLKTLSEEEQQLLGQLIHGAEAEGGASDKLAGSGPPEDADDSDNVYVDSFDDEVDPEVDLFEELDEEAAAALASEIAGMAEPPLSSELGSKQFPFRHNKKFEAPLRVSRESKLLIWQLWTKDPEAWNPKALSRAFGFRIERIRAILRHQQIELERMLKGEYMDDTIDRKLEARFGVRHVGGEGKREWNRPRLPEHHIYQEDQWLRKMARERILGKDPEPEWPDHGGPDPVRFGDDGLGGVAGEEAQHSGAAEEAEGDDDDFVILEDRFRSPDNPRYEWVLTELGDDLRNETRPVKVRMRDGRLREATEEERLRVSSMLNLPDKRLWPWDFEEVMATLEQHGGGAAAIPRDPRLPPLTDEEAAAEAAAATGTDDASAGSKP